MRKAMVATAILALVACSPPTDEEVAERFEEVAVNRMMGLLAEQMQPICVGRIEHLEERINPDRWSKPADSNRESMKRLDELEALLDEVEEELKDIKC